MDIFYDKALNIKDDLISWRRYFHMYPELDYDLYRTSSKIKDFLIKENIEFKETAKTGLCGIIKGNGKKTIAIRADMDALPIEEKNNKEYNSLNKGKMHACGHDAHMAILMGTCRILNSLKDKLNGNIKLLFEPAEETTGGSKIMVKDGVLKDVDAIIGLHVEEWLECGKVGIKKGVVNAASNPFTVKIIGKGGHGASPHNTVDPIVIASNVILALQTIVSREISPTNAAVITIGSIHGGTAQNIIPEEVTIGGIMRTMTKEDRAYVKVRFKEMVEGIVHSMGGKCEINIEESYPNLYNNDDLYNAFFKSAYKILKNENICALDKPSMGVESFAYFSMEKPSLFYYLGCGNKEKNIVNPAHSCYFDIDENCLPIGAAINSRLAFDLLNN